MPRRKRHPEIFATDRDEISRQMHLLRSRMAEAKVSMIPFSPHYEALSELAAKMQECENALHGRPKDWRPPSGFLS